MRKLFMALLFSTAFMFTGGNVFSQAHPEYALDPGHPAYPTGNTFSGDPEFLRGWCFAWDATSPVVQSGAVVKVFRRTISMGGPNLSVPMVIAYGIFSNGIQNYVVNVTIKFGYTYALEMINMPTPNTALFYENAVGIRDYADQLPDEEKRFWYGYAGCLEMAAQNPLFLYIQWGQIV